LLFRPHAVEEGGDFPGQPGGAYPQFGERASADEPRVGKLAREPLGVSVGVDQVDPVPEHQGRRGDRPALLGGRGERSHQHTAQHGGGPVRVRADGADQRVKRADARRRQPGDQAEREPGVAHVQQERHEGERRGGCGGLKHRHFEYQAAHPLGCLRRGQQAHVGAERDTAEYRPVHAELVEQGDHMLCVQVHAVRARLGRLIALAMTEQVEQDDAVAAVGQRPGQPPAQLAVEEDRVQPYENSVSRTVDLVAQAVLTAGKHSFHIFIIVMNRLMRTRSKAVLRVPSVPRHRPVRENILEL
jgi:hypothetical protein